MIGNSTPEYVFIVACVFILRSITPLSVLYVLAFVVTNYRPRPVPIFVEAWCIAETLFYFFICLPRQFYLQTATIHPELVSRDERKKLFNRTMANISDPEHYLQKWFLDSPPSEIKRENLKEFLRWAFLSTDEIDVQYEEELDDYVETTEKLFGRTFDPGRGKAKCLRLTLDKVDMIHRSLWWYFCVFVVDTISSVRLYYIGFDYYRTPISRFFDVIPPRPHNLLAPNVSPSDTITYWHRPHTSKSKLPIVFIHGIGIGLYPYIPFLTEINASKSKMFDHDGDIGILAIEIMPVSFRITGTALRKDDMVSQIEKILDFHGWDRFVLISHSYGSVISTHLLHTQRMQKRIGPVLLLDPVSLLLHLPDVAYNFVYRKPHRANEHQLYYFASKDMGVSHTLSRCFFWSENILWKEDIGDRRMTVSLSGCDLIVDTETVGAYIAGADAASKESGEWKQRAWSGQGIDLLWFAKLDHAQVFDKKATRDVLVNVVREYCSQ